MDFFVALICLVLTYFSTYFAFCSVHSLLVTLFIRGGDGGRGEWVNGVFFLCREETNQILRIFIYVWQKKSKIGEAALSRLNSNFFTHEYKKKKQIINHCKKIYTVYIFEARARADSLSKRARQANKNTQIIIRKKKCILSTTTKTNPKTNDTTVFSAYVSCAQCGAASYAFICRYDKYTLYIPTTHTHYYYCYLSILLFFFCYDFY